MGFRLAFTLIVFGAVVAAGSAPAARPAPKKPEVLLKAVPPFGFAPAKMQFSVTLKGGDNDYQPFYCADIEWDWDDGTTSSKSTDCEPYKAGQSEIIRHYSATHIYHVADSYKPAFKLKQKDKVVALVTTDVEVRSGME